MESILYEISNAFASCMSDGFWPWVWSKITSDQIRNLVLSFGAPLGLVLAWWRSLVASKQTKLASDQIALATQSAYMDRFQKGSQMLGDERLSVRQAGVIILDELAFASPDRFALMCRQVLERFVHDRGEDVRKTIPNPSDNEEQKTPIIADDAQSALKTISKIHHEIKPKGERINLGWAYLSGADLSGADLNEANLSGAYLIEAYLIEAHLSKADLSGADLSGADLNEANLIGAYLIAAHLSKANLNGADLSGADLIGAHLIGAYLNKANLIEADLYEADLKGAYLNKANLIEADLREADLRGAHLSKANLNGADLSGADLIGAHLIGAYLNKANLIEADLYEADLKGAHLSGAYLSEADLREADLREADLRGANFRGADLTNAKVTWDQLNSAKTIEGAKGLPPKDDESTEHPKLPLSEPV